MKIIIAPAKKMREEIEYMSPRQQPVFFQKTRRIQKQLATLSIEEIRSMLHCSETIARQAFEMYHKKRTLKDGVPALLAYDGIQYTYMAPQVFDDEEFSYVEEHLRILSGYYGVLKPFDEVVPYRLELDNILPRKGFENLYEFWGKLMYQELTKTDHELLDLASRQYSKIITRYLGEKDHYARCFFMEEEHGEFREKGVYVKMARGEMVRYLTEIKASAIEEAKGFERLGYHFEPRLSDEKNFVFTRKTGKRNSR